MSARPQSSLCHLSRFQGAFNCFFWALQVSVSPISLLGMNSLRDFYYREKHFLAIISWYIWSEQIFFAWYVRSFAEGSKWNHLS